MLAIHSSLNASCVSHGVAHVTSQPQVASHGTGVVSVYNADMTMY
jgi:hypothetical protein